METEDDPALWIAACEGRTDDVRELLAEEVDIEERGGAHESSSLQIASLHGYEEIVVLLLEHGADVAARTGVSGWTSLMVAAHRGHEAVVYSLLGNGADLLSKNTAGRTAEELATDGHQHEIAAMLKAEIERRQAEAERREAVRRAQCEAFAMGHQERLGAGSRVRELDAGVVQMVLECV